MVTVVKKGQVLQFSMCHFLSIEIRIPSSNYDHSSSLNEFLLRRFVFNRLKKESVGTIQSSVIKIIVARLVGIYIHIPKYSTLNQPKRFIWHTRHFHKNFVQQFVNRNAPLVYPLCVMPYIFYISFLYIFQNIKNTQIVTHFKLVHKKNVIA